MEHDSAWFSFFRTICWTISMQFLPYRNIRTNSVFKNFSQNLKMQYSFTHAFNEKIRHYSTKNGHIFVRIYSSNEECAWKLLYEYILTWKSHKYAAIEYNSIYQTLGALFATESIPLRCKYSQYCVQQQITMADAIEFD